MEKHRFGNISFTTENIEEFVEKYKSQNDLLPIYMDRIRNGYELTDSMMEKIESFDTRSKMKLLAEYNRVMKIFTETVNCMMK